MSRTGLVHNLPIEQYHADREHVSKSGLDDIERSPYHFQALRAAGAPPREVTPAMVLGNMTHCAVLEPRHFEGRYVIAPKVDRRTTAGKADWQAFLTTIAPGQEIADAAMVEQSRAMAASVLRIKPVADLLSKGQAEVSAYWTDSITGVRCRCRPDWVSPVGENAVILFDLKSAIDASPDGFARAVARWNYAKQAAFYTDGWEAATGQEVLGFVFGAVEKEYPFAAAAYMLDEEDIRFGRRQYQRNLAVYAGCLDSGVWPGYTSGDEVQLLTLPPWAKKE